MEENVLPISNNKKKFKILPNLAILSIFAVIAFLLLRMR